MRTTLLMTLLLPLACTRPTEKPQLIPHLGARVQLHVLPGDVFTWVQERRPRLLIEAQGVAPADAPRLLEALTASVSLVNERGERLESEVRQMPAERSANPEQLEPLAVELTPAGELGEGWHELRVETGNVAGFDKTGEQLVVDGALVTRFAVESRPTVRRVVVCEATGALQVRFSEPVHRRLELAEALDLRNEQGEPLPCTREPRRVAMDADGETLSLECTEPLPSRLQLAIAEDAFTAETDLSVRDLDGQPFARLLTLAELPLMDTPDCHVWVPGLERRARR